MTDAEADPLAALVVGEEGPGPFEEDLGRIVGEAAGIVKTERGGQGFEEGAALSRVAFGPSDPSLHAEREVAGLRHRGERREEEDFLIRGDRRRGARVRPKAFSELMDEIAEHARG